MFDRFGKHFPIHADHMDVLPIIILDVTQCEYSRRGATRKAERVGYCEKGDKHFLRNYLNSKI